MESIVSRYFKIDVKYIFNSIKMYRQRIAVSVLIGK